MFCCFLLQEKAQETLEFMMSEIGRMESEKHSLVLKEVLGLTWKYPHLLTASLINKVASIDEGGATSATKTCIQELKNEFNHQVKIGRRRIHKWHRLLPENVVM
jgi:hypothetical protein